MKLLLGAVLCLLCGFAAAQDQQICPSEHELHDILMSNITYELESTQRMRQDFSKIVDKACFPDRSSVHGRWNNFYRHDRLKKAHQIIGGLAREAKEDAEYACVVKGELARYQAQ